VADAGLISEYLLDLGRALPRRRSERVVFEVQDHLLERANHLMAEGHTPEDAERRAVEGFGDPSTVAREFDRTGGAMPSTFTRWSGLIGLLSVPVMVAAQLFYETQKVEDDLHTVSEVEGVPWGLLIPAAMILIGFAGLVARTWGAFGWVRGASATVLIAVGFSVQGYGTRGVIASVMILAGLVLVFEVIYREAILPRPATALLVASGLIICMLMPTGVEKQSWPYYLAFAMLTVTWIWLQYTLWSERPERGALAGSH